MKATLKKLEVTYLTPTGIYGTATIEFKPLFGRPYTRSLSVNSSIYPSTGLTPCRESKTGEYVMFAYNTYLGTAIDNMFHRMIETKEQIITLI